MEQNFQTSFIPKKPMIEERVVAPRSIGFFTLISFFIFITMLVASGGLYLYKGILIKSAESKQKDLDLAKNSFEPAKIEQLQVLDKRLTASHDILSEHIAISPIFKILQDITMKSVRYNKFTYDLNASPDDKILISLKGQALNYTAVALQSDLFTSKKEMIDPIFSNLSLDPKGNILFDLEFFVDPSLVDYTQMLQIENPKATVPAETVPTQIVPTEAPAY